MMKEYITIDNGHIKIPAALWGKPNGRIIIAIHGDLSNKEDAVIELLAKTAIPKGYRVLSFDLPGYGDRKDDSYECNPLNCISDFRKVYDYAESLGKEIVLFGCSIGAYFSLLALQKSAIKKTLFLSPVVNMGRIIQSMMDGFQVSEHRLKEEQRISLPIGKTLDWEYYTYVKQHPINFNWNSSINVLYGSDDVLTSQEEIKAFAQRYNAELTILEGGKHYFHTKQQLQFYENWLDMSI